MIKVMEIFKNLDKQTYLTTSAPPLNEYRVTIIYSSSPAFPKK